MPGHATLLEKTPTSAPRGARTPDAARQARVSAPALGSPVAAGVPSGSGGVGTLQAMQRLVGNQAVMRMLDARRPGTSAAPASGPHPVQRTDWSGWEEQFGRISPKTEGFARLGMAIVDFLRERTGVNVRIGGSLSAAMFGGRRKPVDIDIDVPVEKAEESKKEEVGQSNVDVVKSRFGKLGAGATLATGNDLFFVKALSKTSAGYKVQYLHARTAKPLDPDLDDEEVEEVEKGLKDKVLKEVTVDFSPESIFTLSGLNVDAEGADQGYYGPEFLLAAYLNRYLGNVAGEAPDTKNDLGQITSLLERMLATRLTPGADASDMEEFLLTVKKSVITKYVSEDNEMLRSQVDVLFDKAIGKVIESFYFL